MSVAVLNIVALTKPVLAQMPRLSTWADGQSIREITPPLPAVTTTAQSCALTGVMPSDHGIVGNGWYNRDDCEVRFWQQPNRLVQSEKVWEMARRLRPGTTCLSMFWWYNMHLSADWSVTPRPIYCADGRKIPDCASNPPSLRDDLQRELGRFPLFRFWGPASDISSSKWIADATEIAVDRFDPTITLAYLPHLDYGLQKFGPDHERVRVIAREIDDVAAPLIEFLEAQGYTVLVMSEYGIDPVDHAVFPNRALREAGMISIRRELGRDQLVPGDCGALAVCDHQVAHVYVNDPDALDRARAILRDLPGVDQVLGPEDVRAAGLDHARSGDLVLLAEKRAWFAYDYWLDDAAAPDYARTVDIHRKPGYDPRELFMHAPPIGIAWRLLRKKLGFRQLMNVIPLDTSVVRGSHGRVDGTPPLLIGPGNVVEPAQQMTDVRDAVLRGLGLDGADG